MSNTVHVSVASSDFGVLPAPLHKMRSITIYGKRWFQKTWGNTYHSVDVLVDGNLVHRIDFSYGYGGMYMQNAQTWLEQNGYLPGLRHYDNGGYEPLWQYCRDRGINLLDNVTDVSRKKDL
jgi:hypothetical protein